jgi:hypothetical protein
MIDIAGQLQIEGKTQSEKKNLGQRIQSIPYEGKTHMVDNKSNNDHIDNALKALVRALAPLATAPTTPGT